LRFSLQKFGIDIDYKWKRTTSEIEGVSFRYGNVAFKGSQVDRKFSFGNLKKQFEKNIEELKKQGREEYLRELAEQEAAKKATPTKQNLVIKGVELNDEQQKTLMSGDYIFLENMTSKNGTTKFSAYAFLNDEKSRVFFSDKNPDEFIKHGKYEMRIRDKILVENGHVTKAKVKWHGMGNYAYPHLWKTDKSDSEYKESWDDPRLPKSQKSEQKQIQPNIPKNNRGRKI